MLGPTPIQDVTLQAGSYVLVLRAPGRPLVHYPVHIEREGHWSGSPPGKKRPTPVFVPPEGMVPRSMCYIPEGWAIFGGDPHARGSPPRQRLWTYGYFIGRHAVTHREYLSYLNAMMQGDDREQALDRVPCIKVPRLHDSVPLYSVDGAGQLVPCEDSPLGPLRLDAPVTLVRWHDAAAYCLWLAESTGLPFRLPSELEREKAGRGVDGRPFPWGSHSDPGFHCTQDSPLEYPAPPATSSFVIDTSPYQVRALAGGVADWCMDTFRHRGPRHQGAFAKEPEPLTSKHGRTDTRPERRVVRGGSFDGVPQNGRCAARAGQSSSRRKVGVGFRLALSLSQLLTTSSED